MRTAFFLLCSLLCIPVSFAHSDGLSLEREVGGILIDIGFGKAMPAAGSTLTYSFDLFNVVNPEAYVFEPFSRVHVRIFQERQELLDRTLENNGVDVPFLSFNYKEAGDYSMSVIFERNGKDPIQASFGYRVNEAEQPVASSQKSGLLFGIGAVLIAVVTGMILRGRQA